MAKKANDPEFEIRFFETILRRHPMYASALVMLLGIPIALGSWWGVLVLGAILPALIWRLIDEERFLARDLAGYRDYQQRVRYRLIPRVW